MKAILFFLGILGCFSTYSQTIIIDYSPPMGVYNQIKGHVEGIDPKKVKLVPIVNVFETYWSKPFINNPTVEVAADGTFSVLFITGGQDLCAEQIFLFLYPIETQVSVLSAGFNVPDEYYRNSLTSIVVDRRVNSEITWSGRTWTRKDTAVCQWDPGLNYFLRENAYVDTNGKLHLSIRHIDGQWRCSEVVLKESLGYGSYRIYLDSDLSTFPDPIVFGFFTYDHNWEQTHREIDVEFSNGLVVGRGSPWQYVIQPYQNENHRYRMELGPLSKSTHTITWLRQLASFESFNQHVTFTPSNTTVHVLERNVDAVSFYWLPFTYLTRSSYPTNWIVDGDVDTLYHRQFYRILEVGHTNNASTSPISHWNSAISYGMYKIPEPGNEKVHLNLWLHDRTAPSLDTNQVFEVVISKFEYVPPVPGRDMPKLEILPGIVDPPLAKLKVKVE